MSAFPDWMQERACTAAGAIVAAFDTVPVAAVPADPGLPAAPWAVLAAFSAVAGACIGSFLNVCIYRIPLDQSVVRPGSHCMTCGAPIKWYHNLPVLSYFLLRGKCASCGARFSFRYAGIEILTALLFAAVFCMWPPMGAAPPLGFRALGLAAGAHGSTPYPPWSVPALWLFLSGLVVGTFVDFDHYIIPDSVTKGGIVAGLLLSFLVPQLQAQVEIFRGWPAAGPCAVLCEPASRAGGLARSILGAVAGYALVQCVRKGGTWWMRRRGRIGKDEEAMGYGDVKFAAAIGAFLGWQAAAFSLVAGSVFGCLAALPAMAARRRGMLARIPFGPFLSLGAALWVFWGHRLLVSYLFLRAPWRVEVF